MENYSEVVESASAVYLWAIPRATLGLAEVDSSYQQRKLLVAQHDLPLIVARLRPCETTALKTFCAHP
jgi:hypothetical protein